MQIHTILNISVLIIIFSIIFIIIGISLNNILGIDPKAYKKHKNRVNPNLKNEILSENDNYDIRAWISGICGRFETPEAFEKSMIKRNLLLPRSADDDDDDNKQDKFNMFNWFFWNM
jgi:hypothetical protein